MKYKVVINEGRHCNTIAVVDENGQSAFDDLNGRDNHDAWSDGLKRANLFAAAPEMLAVLELMVEFIKLGQPLYWGGLISSSDKTAGQLVLDAIARARGLIGHYLVTVTQLVPDADLADSDDKKDNPQGQYLIKSDSEDHALDDFHFRVPIGCMDDFSVEIEKVSLETLKKTKGVKIL